jgi:hypothetical protein
MKSWGRVQEELYQLSNLCSWKYNLQLATWLMALLGLLPSQDRLWLSAIMTWIERLDSCPGEQAWRSQHNGNSISFTWPQGVS